MLRRMGTINCPQFNYLVKIRYKGSKKYGGSQKYVLKIDFANLYLMVAPVVWNQIVGGWTEILAVKDIVDFQEVAIILIRPGHGCQTSEVWQMEG